MQIIWGRERGGVSTHSVLSPSQTVIAYALSAQRGRAWAADKINPDAGMLATTSESGDRPHDNRTPVMEPHLNGMVGAFGFGPESRPGGRGQAHLIEWSRANQA